MFYFFRTRIFAPDPSKETTQPEVNNYFVNDNGDVFSTEKPIKPTPTEIKLAEPEQNLKNFKDKKEYVPTLTKDKSVDLEPLLEEPLKDHFGNNNDDEVEVIQSKENSDDEEMESPTEAIGHDAHNSTLSSVDEHSKEEYEDDDEHHQPHDDDDYYSDDEVESMDNTNDIQNGRHHKDNLQEEEKEDEENHENDEDETITENVSKFAMLL